MSKNKDPEVKKKAPADSPAKFSHTTTPIQCLQGSNFYIHPGTTPYTTTLTPFKGLSFELKVEGSQGYYGNVSLKNCVQSKVRFLKFRLMPGQQEKLDFELEPNGLVNIPNVQFSAFAAPGMPNQIRFVCDFEFEGNAQNYNWNYWIPYVSLKIL